MALSELRSNLKGVTDSKHGGKVTQYRGIKYASIAQRFAKPIINNEWHKITDYTTFGPRCPQLPFKLQESLLIPKHAPRDEKPKEDELNCANLTVTCPSDTNFSNLPVFIWIYGGGQVITAGSAADQYGDARPLVAQSIEQGKPIVLVSIHYRLNIFGYGDGETEINLGLQDQRAAVEWVHNHIAVFGGNPSDITLGGQSAGAIYSHALIASGFDKYVSRIILASGSLYCRPPRSERDCVGFIRLVEGNLQLIEMEKGNMNPGEAVAATLLGAPVDRIIETIRDLDISTLWMWPEKSLKDWEKDATVFKNLKGVMIGDTEYEAAIYEHIFSKLSASRISQCFDTNPALPGRRLKKAYNIDENDEVLARKGALAFYGDARFNFPAHQVAKNINQIGTGVKAYQYQFDEVNPFAKIAAARAHHGIDVMALFGGYDDYVNENMLAVGKITRAKFIDFVNGAEPWDSEKVFGFGPNGKSGELSAEEVTQRRRLEQWKILEELAPDGVYQEIWMKLLAAGATATER